MAQSLNIVIDLILHARTLSSSLLYNLKNFVWNLMVINCIKFLMKTNGINHQMDQIQLIKLGEHHFSQLLLVWAMVIIFMQCGSNFYGAYIYQVEREGKQERKNYYEKCLQGYMVVNRKLKKGVKKEDKQKVKSG
eukprot:190534_1